MAWKVYKKGNYLYVENTETGLLIEGGASTFEFRKRLDSDNSYELYKDEKSINLDNDFKLSELQKENGDPYTEAEFEEFKEFSTGFNWPRTQGTIKLDFNRAGQTPYSFQLLAGVETQVDFPTPFNVNSITNYPINVPTSKRVPETFFRFDETYGMRIKENEINLQETDYRWIFQYTRSSASTDEQIQTVLRNPISGFETEASSSMLRGNVTEVMTLSLNTVADKFSLESQGIGAGYQLFMKSTINITVTPSSWKTRFDYKDRLIPFL